MGKLTNALQGRLNGPKGRVKESQRQLDLFSSLADRQPTAPRIVMSPPESSPAPAPEPELVLPPSGSPPPDVSADVRAVLSESGAPRQIEVPVSGEGRPPLRTGVYHRPRRVAPPPAPVRPADSPPPPRARRAWLGQVRDWFSGVELDRRMVTLLGVLIVFVALIAWWTARPRGAESPAASADAGDASPPAVESATPGIAPLAPVPIPPAAPAAKPQMVAADWKIAGAETVLAGGAYLVKFTEPAFESGDMISIKGLAALKAVGAKLATLKAGTRVVVTGFTDDTPLSKPTDRFKSNTDIAAARAKAAVAQLAKFSRAAPGLAFEEQAGEPAQTPYPNDTPANRRLNRTVTVQVIPAP